MREIVAVCKGRRIHLDRNDPDRWIEAKNIWGFTRGRTGPRRLCCHVMVNQAETDSIQPSDPARYILLDVGSAKKVNRGMRYNALGRDFDFVSERLKLAVRRSETLANTT